MSRFWRFFISIAIVFSIGNLSSMAQSVDLQLALERYVEQSDKTVDYSDYLETLETLFLSPLNLNQPEQLKPLLELQIIDVSQLSALQSYIEKSGHLLSINELLYIDGFSAEELNLLQYVCVAEPIARIDQEYRGYLKQQYLLRFQRVFRNDEAYQPLSDSVWAQRPNARYLGSPNKLYMRYKLAVGSRWQAALVAEKDAGEAFFNKAPIGIDTLIERPYAQGFDFYSAFVGAQRIGFLNQLVIGDYQLRLGQGLNMWTTPAFGKTLAVESTQRYASGIKGNTSASEGAFLRGVAADMQLSHAASLFVFASHTPRDALIKASDSSLYFTSISQDAYHRTLSELNKKHALKVKLLGAALQWKSTRWKFSLIHSYTHFSHLLRPQYAVLYKRFVGDKMQISGADYAFNYRSIYFFGECSYHHQQKSLAFLQGVSGKLNHLLKYTVLYRYYPASYDNIWANAFGEQGRNSNERGLYVGLSLPISPACELKAYADMFKTPWIKLLESAPSYGYDNGLICSYKASNDIGMYAHIRYRYKGRNILVSDYFKTPEYAASYAFRYRVDYALSDRISMRSQMDYRCVNNVYLSQGVYLAQDIGYVDKSEKWSFRFRMAVFSTDDYTARIYAYEHNVLYAFSVPVFYHRGLRNYLVARYKCSSQLSFWCKVAATSYMPIHHVSIAAQRNGFELSLQLQWKPNVYRSRTSSDRQ